MFSFKRWIRFIHLFFPRTFIRTLYDVRVLRSGLGTLGKSRVGRSKEILHFFPACVYVSILNSSELIFL